MFSRHFTGADLDIALGVAFIEGAGPEATDKLREATGSTTRRAAYLDAVGDLKLMTDKWGPSLTVWQIRTLRRPQDWPYPDSLRVAADLWADKLDHAAAVAAALRKRYGWGIWSAYKHGTYEPHAGLDFELVTGWRDADKWNS